MQQKDYISYKFLILIQRFQFDVSQQHIITKNKIYLQYIELKILVNVEN